MYNGWTNYATWRINLEIFDNIDSDNWEDDIEELSRYGFGGHLKNYVEQRLECENDLTLSYALAFINDVNWTEIANHIVDDYEENYCCLNCNKKIDDDSFLIDFCSVECSKEHWFLADHPKG